MAVDGDAAPGSGTDYTDRLVGELREEVTKLTARALEANPTMRGLLEETLAEARVMPDSPDHLESLGPATRSFLAALDAGADRESGELVEKMVRYFRYAVYTHRNGAT